MNFNITDSAKIKIQELQKSDNNLMLRIAVQSGGCQGFQYQLTMTKEKNPDDFVVSENNINYIVLDQDAIFMLQGGQIDFVSEMSGSYFKIFNPNKSGGCGCGKSFSA